MRKLLGVDTRLEAMTRWVTSTPAERVAARLIELDNTLGDVLDQLEAAEKSLSYPTSEEGT